MFEVESKIVKPKYKNYKNSTKNNFIIPIIIYSNSDDFIEFSPNNSNISFFDYDSLNLIKK